MTRKKGYIPVADAFRYSKWKGFAWIFYPCWMLLVLGILYTSCFRDQPVKEQVSYRICTHYDFEKMKCKRWETR